MNRQKIFLINKIGTINEIISPYKAIISFEHQGKRARALLVAGRLMENKKPLPKGIPIVHYVKIGTVVEFSGHSYNDHENLYYVTMAYIHNNGVNTQSKDNPPRDMTPRNCLQDVYGTVIEIHAPYKAILSFQLNNMPERALLRADKIVKNGQNVPMGEPITDHVKMGSKLQFVCHGFDETGQDRCGYFVTVAWLKDVNERGNKSDIKAFIGLYNASGVIVDVSHRQGVIQYTDADGKDQNVLFFASKLFLFGKRTSAKQNINLTLSVDDKVQFDAVPCEQTENDSHCPWFATVVWKGKKPAIDYDNPLASNPKSLFVRVKGQILKILNEEYGVAIAAMKPNNWESVLFHRSACFLFKLNLGSHDLTKIFQEANSFKAVLDAYTYPKPTKMANLSCEIQMEFTAEHRTFIVNSYLRTVRFIGGLYRYNLRVCLNEFLLAYPKFQQISRKILCEGFTG
ncbi:hypothetical protein C0J52_16724 [Blattella germanica]|nr:hypothetical protein C0J52_16724 [Blattella germanica]